MYTQVYPPLTLSFSLLPLSRSPLLSFSHLQRIHWVPPLQRFRPGPFRHTPPRPLPHDRLRPHQYDYCKPHHPLLSTRPTVCALLTHSSHSLFSPTLLTHPSHSTRSLSARPSPALNPLSAYSPPSLRPQSSTPSPSSGHSTSPSPGPHSTSSHSKSSSTSPPPSCASRWGTRATRRTSRTRCSASQGCDGTTTRGPFTCSVIKVTE